MIITSRIKKVFWIGAAVMAFAAGLWYYYTYTQNQIQTYRTNAELALKAEEQTRLALEQQQRDLEELQDLFEETSQRFAEAEERVSRLEEVLSEHELGYLAANRPGLVENIIDKGTKDVLRCFEIASGSPLTEDEINATKPSEINGSCPDIANPNYRP